MQKQLEKRILEVEKMKQQEQEERRQAVDAVEKQVSMLPAFIQGNFCAYRCAAFYAVVTNPFCCERLPLGCLSISQ